jgi:hypothetical protein
MDFYSFLHYVCYSILGLIIWSKYRQLTTIAEDAATAAASVAAKKLAKELEENRQTLARAEEKLSKELEKNRQALARTETLHRVVVANVEHIQYLISNSKDNMDETYRNTVLIYEQALEYFRNNENIKEALVNMEFIQNKAVAAMMAHLQENYMMGKIRAYAPSHPDRDR